MKKKVQDEYNMGLKGKEKKKKSDHPEKKSLSSRKKLGVVKSVSKEKGFFKTKKDKK